MTKDKSILIKNIYYMLAYAFQVLDIKEFESVEGEKFENINDLFSEILFLGIGYQLRHGLCKEYEPKKDDLVTLKGKIDIGETIKNKSNGRQGLNCDYDEFTENNVFNQILKTTSYILMTSSDIKQDRKKKLRKRLAYFSNVDFIAPSSIAWNRLYYQRNNRSYHLLMSICYFVLSNKLLTTENGKYKAAQFLDEQQMSRLFEKFILEYYRKHYPSLSPYPNEITWDFDAKPDERWPSMKTDITLMDPKLGTLIIDTKYYGSEMQNRFGKDTYHSANIYQIYAYVNNEDKCHDGRTSGMLLYAKTEDDPPLDSATEIGGHHFYVRTLDLNCRFEQIKRQLNQIVTDWRDNAVKETKGESRA